MVFGFNTEVAREGVVYHVQSELRTAENLLQSQVFVSGRCIGKIDAPIPAHTEELQAQQMLREQHRRLVQSAREGSIAELLSAAEPALTLSWPEGGPRVIDSTVKMRIVVSAGDKPVEGARLSVHLTSIDREQTIEATSGVDGCAEVVTSLSADDLNSCRVQVRAQHGERKTDQRFRLERAQP